MTDLTLGGAVRAAVLQAPGPDARRDAELLLQAVTGLSRAGLMTYPERVLSASEQTAFRALWQRRQQGEPIAYLLGWREFYGLRLSVSPAVLIPRPETELLVDAALQRLPESATARVLDLGTGSGAIALAIAANRRMSEVVATDVSEAALTVARNNAHKLGLGAVQFQRSDWFQGLDPALRFDVIVSNPPYIAEHDPHLQQGDLCFEPRQALTPGGDGLLPYRLIIDAARRHLSAGGWLLFEHGLDQAASIRELFLTAGYESIATLADLEARDRVTLGRFGASR